MSARILDGKGIAEALLDDLAKRVQARLAAGKPAPGLAVVLVGDDPASAVYVRNKRRAAAKVGIRAVDYDLPAGTSDEELLALIDQLNADPAIRSEEHTSELQSRENLVCRLLLEKKNPE